MPGTPVMHYRQKFSSAHDIAAITVNRWPHGYGYAANSLFVLIMRTPSRAPGSRWGAYIHCQFRRCWRSLRSSRHRPGRACCSPALAAL